MTTPLFEAKNLQKYFPVKGGILNRKMADVKAVMIFHSPSIQAKR